MEGEKLIKISFIYRVNSLRSVSLLSAALGLFLSVSFSPSSSWLLPFCLRVDARICHGVWEV